MDNLTVADFVEANLDAITVQNSQFRVKPERFAQIKNTLIAIFKEPHTLTGHIEEGGARTYKLIDNMNELSEDTLDQMLLVDAQADGDNVADEAVVISMSDFFNAFSHCPLPVEE